VLFVKNCIFEGNFELSEEFIENEDSGDCKPLILKRTLLYELGKFFLDIIDDLLEYRLG